MKRFYIVIIMILISLGFPEGLSWYCQFTEKHYVPCLNYWQLDGVSSDFYPMAYWIYHDEETWNDFLKIPSCERYIIPSSKIPFDFDSYSYIFVYGAKIKSVHWSKKETMFDEPKTVYFKLKDRNLEYAIIEYEEPDNGVYIYQIDHNEQLSKFFGP
ncbi:hypothetical protein [uncultured Alistipes sp.]|uniref:hypothetical protein n=1 Tax=uncultured Alistipes sp. TaxID=538949 RepID=UPI002611689C|nr:hypothetical protein [uncultured Alistipes sp.]